MCLQMRKVSNSLILFIIRGLTMMSCPWECNFYQFLTG